MSASLVGSEMCIRDRISLARRSCPGPPRRSSGAHRRRERGRREPAGSGACLLYTSDAADDM
eukprot:10079276-Alexandrium_andersonii.AAC.1